MNRFHRFSAKVVVLTALALLLSVARVGAADPYGKPASLNLVSVGIAAIPRPGLSAIPSCKKDAEDMVRWADSQRSKLFGGGHTTALIEGKATAKNILDAMKGLKGTAKASDYSIVYLSSHGGCGRNDWNFCAYDRNIAWTEIQTALRDVPGTVIVIIDACQCGGVKGDNLIVLSASLKNQLSGGCRLVGMNSLFTRFLMEGLNGAADTNGDGIITLSEVETYVSNRLVQENMRKNAKDHQTMTVTRPGNVSSALPLSRSAAPAARDLTGLTFDGSEQLGKGYGKLSFRFLANGKAVMVDARSTVNGTYKIEGNRVVLNFPGSSDYSGIINGDTITGSGIDATRNWTFSVTKPK